MNGKKYTYKVVAYKTVSGKTYKSPSSKAAAHYFVSRSAINNLTSTSSGVHVQWSQNSKATGYYIYRDGSKVKTVSGSSVTSWTDTGAARNGEEFNYQVVAFKKVNGVIYRAAASGYKYIIYRRPVVVTPTPTPRPTTPEPSQPYSNTVYITKSGEKYHRDGCGSLSRSKIPISRADAIARGYTPCHNCNPG